MVWFCSDFAGVGLHCAHLRGRTAPTGRNRGNGNTERNGAGPGRKFRYRYWSGGHRAAANAFCPRSPSVCAGRGRCIVRYLDTKADMDNGGGAGQDDPNSIVHSEQVFVRGQGRLTLFDELWEQKLGISFINLDRNYRNDTDAIHPTDLDRSTYHGESLAFDWQHTLRFHKTNILTFGVETREDKAYSDYYSESFFGPNTAEAESYGFELTATVTPLDDLTMRAGYTWTKTEDKSTGMDLLRRPENKVFFETNYRFSKKGNFNLEIAYVGHREDLVYDPVTWAAMRVKLGRYMLANLAASYDVTKWLRLFGRVDNLLDREYEEVSGYGTHGISGYGGLKVSF